MEIENKELFNGEFLQEEVRNDFVVSTEMKKVWAVEMDLLLQVIKICEKYDLKYFTDAGSTLGAVRHGGYIPWDDDMDVVMFRDDYDKFCRYAKKELKHPYFLQTERTDPGTLRGHAQLRNSKTTGILREEEKYHYSFNQGIFIDIFPLDAVPNDQKERTEFLKKLSDLKLRAYKFADYTDRYPYTNLSVGYKKAIKDIFCNFLKVIRFPNVYYWRLEKEAQKYNNKGMDKVGKITFYPFDEKRIWPKYCFDDSIMIDFEMIKVSVPVGYEEILTAYYKNWREIVRKSTTHGDVIFDAEKSYEEYVNGK